MREESFKFEDLDLLTNKWYFVSEISSRDISENNIKMAVKYHNIELNCLENEQQQEGCKFRDCFLESSKFSRREGKRLSRTKPRVVCVRGVVGERVVCKGVTSQTSHELKS